MKRKAKLPPELEWSFDDARRFFGVNRNTLYKRVRDGKVPAHWLGRSLRFDPRELRALRNRPGSPPVDPTPVKRQRSAVLDAAQRYAEPGMRHVIDASRWTIAWSPLSTRIEAVWKEPRTLLVFQAYEAWEFALQLMDAYHGPARLRVAGSKLKSEEEVKS